MGDVTHRDIAVASDAGAQIITLGVRVQSDAAKGAKKPNQTKKNQHTPKNKGVPNNTKIIGKVRVMSAVEVADVVKILSGQ